MAPPHPAAAAAPTTSRLAPALRFLGVDIGATSIDVAVTNAELEVLGHINQPMDVRRGAGRRLRASPVHGRQVEVVGVAEEFDGAGIGVLVRLLPRGRSGRTADHARLDGFPVREALSQDLGCPVMVDNDVNLMAMGSSTRASHAPWVISSASRSGTGMAGGIVVGGEVYRGTTGSAGDIGHIQAVPDGRPCACGNRGCLEAHFSGAALARDATEAAQQGLSAELAARLEAAGTLSAVDAAAAAAAGYATALGLIREGGNRTGQVIAGLVSFFNPGLVVIGGGVTGLGHTLLAAIRTQVYRQSLPLGDRQPTHCARESGRLPGSSARPVSSATTCSRPRNRSRAARSTPSRAARATRSRAARSTPSRACMSHSFQSRT